MARTATTVAGSTHQRPGSAAFFVGFRPEEVRRVDDADARAPVEREVDDARDRPVAGDRFVVAEAPVRVFLGAMSP
jgi:hypothetical protein